METNSIDRFYIRCADCLSIGVVTDVTDRHKWHCSLCAGRIELMGKVVADKKVEVEKFRTACDRRCTHAVGPLCVCKCDCANHGTGRVVSVTVVENIPTVAFISDPEALANVEKFRQDLELLRGAVEICNQKRRDEALPWTERSASGTLSWKLRELLMKMTEARTWKSRHNKVAEAKALCAGR